MKSVCLQSKRVNAHSLPWRLTVGIGVLVVISLLIESCCSCTLQGCSDEVVFVKLTDTTGNDFNACEALVVRWSTAYSSGEVVESESWNNKTTFKLPGTEDYENGEFIEVGTETLHIEILCNDEVLISAEFGVAWETFVCNKCGDFSWCEDDMATTGSIVIEVDPTVFPVDQN